jgi:hypothetical protein
MAEQLLEQEQAADDFTTTRAPLPWSGALRDELDRVIARGGGRWSRALMAVAWIHVVAFGVCHVLGSPVGQSDPRHVVVWFLELAAVFVAMRRVAGRGWFWSPPAVHLVARFWLTLLILSFSLSTLNAMIGWDTLWFKAAWGTLSSFFFAALAWLVTPRFLILAVWMYVTALLMACFVEWNNLIYGVSWWIALMVIAAAIRRRECGVAPRDVPPLFDSST